MNVTMAEPKGMGRMYCSARRFPTDSLASGLGGVENYVAFIDDVEVPLVS